MGPLLCGDCYRRALRTIPPDENRVWVLEEGESCLLVDGKWYRFDAYSFSPADSPPNPADNWSREDSSDSFQDRRITAIHRYDWLSIFLDNDSYIFTEHCYRGGDRLYYQDFYAADETQEDICEQRAACQTCGEFSNLTEIFG